jgi:hypothetical protein
VLDYGVIICELCIYHQILYFMAELNI